MPLIACGIFFSRGPQTAGNQARSGSSPSPGNTSMRGWSSSRTIVSWKEVNLEKFLSCSRVDSEETSSVKRSRMNSTSGEATREFSYYPPHSGVMLSQAFVSWRRGEASPQWGYIGGSWAGPCTESNPVWNLTQQGPNRPHPCTRRLTVWGMLDSRNVTLQ